MTKTKKLTPSMLKVLENLARGRSENWGFGDGRSVAGGMHGTMIGLRQRELIMFNPYACLTIQGAREFIALKADADGEETSAREMRAGAWDGWGDLQAALLGCWGREKTAEEKALILAAGNDFLNAASES